MAKVKGSYKSLVRGVSEQVPHDRLEGQHFEQVNLVSDPIRGLVRRRGSVFKDKLATTPLDSTIRLDIKGFREHSFSALGSDFSVLYAKDGVVGTNPVIVYNKDTEKLVPTSISGTATSRMAAGISSAVSVGRYLLLATRFVPEVTSTNVVAASGESASVWIRGGAYSRTYRLQYGSTSVSYTTPKSYYDGTLNTSDIPYDDPEYQKKVNDRVNAYNTAVNQYIASAQEAIQPEKIAEQLAQKLQEANITCGTAGSHIHVYNLTNADTQLTGSDGGDGNFMRVTHRAVDSLNDLTKLHDAYVTVAVQVSADDVYYVRAEPKRPGAESFQEVTWKEYTRDELAVEFPFVMGTVHNGIMYLGSSPADLEARLPSSFSGTVPRMVPREAGDDTTNPWPDFFSRPVSYLGVFQDRLVVCSGANVFLSVPGDYFNWFRKSALRVDPDDPIEVYALGAEDDTIRGGSLIDRNLILLGDSWHYAISGRDVLTPTNAIVSVQAAHEATTDASPQALGNLLFYGQFQGGLTKLHQMQVGAFADSFDNFSVTQQITRYIRGRPRQLVTSSQPNMVLMSTEDYEHGLYVFSFLDSPGQEQRLFDSWSRWEWDSSLGPIIGMTNSDNGFIVFTYRQCTDGWHIVADEFSRDSSRDPLPYLDSKVWLPNVNTWATPMADKWAVLPATHPRRLFGRHYDEVDDLLALPGVSELNVNVGVMFDSYYEPTPPYLRDESDNAVLSGRTVLSQLGITVTDSAGITVDLQNRGEEGFTHKVVDDAGFRIADPLSPLGAVPLTDRRVAAYVGREIREHRLRIAARSWTPLNIATVEWTMQTFNRR